MSFESLFHCACGATRSAPGRLSMISCVRCGRAMATRIAEAYVPAPSRPVLATATLVSQVLGAVAFVLALVWRLRLGGEGAGIVAVMVAGAACVFAGGLAHRGSVVAVIACVAFDMAIAIACLTELSAAHAFVYVPVASISAAAAAHLPLALAITGLLAVLAAIGCVAGLSQARRFAAWRDAQILQAARVSRG